MEPCMIGKVEFVTGVIGSSFVGLGLQSPTIYWILDTHHSIQVTHVSFVVWSSLAFDLSPSLLFWIGSLISLQNSGFHQVNVLHLSSDSGLFFLDFSSGSIFGDQCVAPLTISCRPSPISSSGVINSWGSFLVDSLWQCFVFFCQYLVFGSRFQIWKFRIWSTVTTKRHIFRSLPRLICQNLCFQIAM